MTYVVSDLHGNLEKFQKLLEQIGFTDDDVMYVIGDIVDCGELEEFVGRNNSCMERID